MVVDSLENVEKSFQMTTNEKKTSADKYARDIDDDDNDNNDDDR